MGAFLLGAGAKGKRYSMPNARIMIHQPLGGASGQARGTLAEPNHDHRVRVAVACLTRTADSSEDGACAAHSAGGQMSPANKSATEGVSEQVRHERPSKHRRHRFGEISAGAACE